MILNLFGKKRITSKELVERCIRFNVPYRVEDNISSVLRHKDIENLEKELTHKFQGVLDTLVIAREDPNSKETAKRLAKMYLHELFWGRYNPRPNITSFPNENEYAYGGMIVVKIELKSVCAHHHQPITGLGYVGIIPNGIVLGLSKYIRLAQWCARRGIVQEQLCTKIAEEIKKASGSEDIAVHLALDHGCCTNRGVNANSALTQTTVLYGKFLMEPGVKEEFFENIKLQSGVK